MAEVKKYQTPVFRLSFPALFQAESYQGNAPKYGATAIWIPANFTEREKRLWSVILKAMDEKSQEAFKKPLKKLPANFKIGLRNGNEKPDLGGYGEGTRFANLTTKMKPGVIDVDKTPIGPEHGNDDLIYPGCYCRATVTVYSFDNKGKGISLGLMNLQRIKDGERLDSRTDAAEDFEDDLDAAESEGDATDDFLDD